MPMILRNKKKLQENKVQKRVRRKLFKNFSMLPIEMRSMVIGEMAIDDRCRFSRTSMLYNREAIASKNYVDSLTFEVCSNQRVVISLKHSSSNRNSGYTVEFSSSYGPKCMEFTTPKYRTRSQLHPSTNLITKACKHFKQILKVYQKSVRKVVLFMEDSNSEIRINKKLFNMDISRMNCLEELFVCGDFQYQQFVLKAKNPLKKLSILDNKHDYKRILWEERKPLKKKQIELPMNMIYDIRDELFMEDLKLNREQFKKLSARKVTIHIGRLTPRDIFDIIQSWRNGTLGREVTEFTWKLDRSHFNVTKLMSLLDSNGAGLWTCQMDLPHFIETGKSATLYNKPRLLTVKFQN